MFRSIRARAAAVLLAAVPLTLALTAEPVATAMPFPPHFPKVLTRTLSKDLVITLRYQTVTFDQLMARALIEIPE